MRASPVENPSALLRLGPRVEHRLQPVGQRIAAGGLENVGSQAKYAVKTRPRKRPENVKQPVVEAREFEDVRLVKEHVAEFRYRPVKCKRDYRVVVVWKELDIYRGQRKLFDDARCCLYITNDEAKSAEGIVFDANARCNRVRNEARSKPTPPPDVPNVGRWQCRLTF